MKTSKDRFTDKQLIGSGTYGEVYKAYDNHLKKTIAFKKIFIQNKQEGIPSTALREISILKGIQHPSIVRLEDVILQPQKIYLVFEYLQQDLKQFLDQLPDNVYLEPQIVKKFMY